MGRGANMSILGLYNMVPDLFNSLALPDGFSSADKQTLIDNLVLDCAELEMLYTDGDFMKNIIGIWSNKELPAWQRIYSASLLEYNPIENYNRTENITDTHSGTDTNQASGKDTNQASGNDTDAHTGNSAIVGSGTDSDIHSKTSFENNTLAVTEKMEMTKGSTQTQNFADTITHTNGRKDELTHGKKEEFTHGHKITRQGNISGNIGVTTSQQMLQQEIDIAPKLNIFNIIIESFKNKFCILVY